jgi:ABC-type sugar transport system substrate-binding protein
MKHRRPRLFIGSSTRAIRIAEAIKRHLESGGDLDVRIWDDGVFPIGQITINALEQALSDYDFAVLVLTADQEIKEANGSVFVPSPNVVFELGLFMGALKRERTFLICENRVRKSILSDLHGLTLGIFEWESGAESSAVRTACAETRAAINRFGANRILQRARSIALIGDSHDSFHAEVWRGLSAEMKNTTFVSPAHERGLRAVDLTTFVMALEHVSRLDASAIVVSPGSREWWNEGRVQVAAQRIIDADRQVVVIENGPSNKVLADAFTVITSDSERGAKALAKYVITLLPSRSGRVLLLFPGFSENAVIRRSILEAELSPSATVEVIDTNSWSEKEAAEHVMRLSKARKHYDFVICGNDDMALGVVIALRTIGETKTKVVGYNGTYRAIAAVAEPQNPLIATMRIPAFAYGSTAARHLNDLFRGVIVATAVSADLDIPFDSMNLVTEQRATDMLLRAVWDV